MNKHLLWLPVAVVAYSIIVPKLPFGGKVIATAFLFAAVLTWLFILFTKIGNEKKSYWEKSSPITVTGYIDDVVVLCTYKRGLFSNSVPFCVVEFVDTKGDKQYKMVKVASVHAAKKNLGKAITFEYIEDGYCDQTSQLNLQSAAFNGNYYTDLVGISESQAKADAAVITLHRGGKLTITYKVYSVKYSSTPRDYPPSILCNKNSRLRIPYQVIQF